MNILVTGSNGQLGNEIRIVAKGSKDNYIFTDVCDEHPESIEMLHKLAGEDVDTATVKLDITNLNAIHKMVRENEVNVIINCAAWTNVEGAEEPEKSDLVELLNAKAPENLALAMREVNGLLVHISTDYVFGKEAYNTPCKEDQQGTPTGVYGLTKLHGEQAIQNVGCKYVIIRTAWLYSEFGNNFVKSMLNLTASKPQLKVVFDQVGTPTYAGDLAKAITTVLSNPVGGIYHYSNEGVCSWFDFAKIIAEFAENTTCDIQPCHSNEFPSKVQRPAYSVLDKTKIKDVIGIKIPYWVESLKQCMSYLLD